MYRFRLPPVAVPLGLLLLLGALLPVRRAAAIGEVGGRIGGTVYIESTRDGLAGVQIVVRSPSLIGGAQRTTTAEDGSYLFQNLPPGTYELSADIEGFTPVRLTNVQVVGGQKAQVDIPLRVGGLAPGQTHTIVEKTNPALNFESAAMVTTLSNEKVSKTPIFRQIQTVLQLAPGTGPGNSPSVRGGLARYARFLIDGMDTTDIVTGGITAPMNFDAVEQYNLFIGAMDAEYNSLGAVQNMVTRSGGNRFTVDGSVFIQPAFTYDPTRYSSGDPANAQLFNNRLLYDDRPQPERSFYSGNLNLGGPVVKDKLWFFVSFQFNYNRRSVPMPAVPWHGEEVRAAYDRHADTYTYLGRAKLTWQATRDTRIQLSFNIDRNFIRNAVASTTLLPEADRRIDRGGEFIVLLWDTLLTPKLLFQLQTGLTTKRSVEDTILLRDGQPDRVTPAHTIRSQDQWNGFTYLNSPSGWDQETKYRVQFDPSLLYSTTGLGGTHNIKGGMQFAYMRYERNNGVAGGRIYTDNFVTDPMSGAIIPCDPTNPATFAACNQVRDFPESEPQGGTAGLGLSNVAQALNVGFFLQDRFTVGRWLTVVPGMRMDLGVLYDSTGAQTASLLGFGPRLSLIYDLFRDRTTLVEAHYGRHNDVGNAFVANRSNPAPISILRQWNPATRAFEERNRSGGPGGQIFAASLTPPSLDEVQAGIRREVLPQTVVGLTYVYRLYQHLWVNEEINQIWDPGGTRVVGYANGRPERIFRAATPADARRTYHGLDLWVQGNPGRFDVVASYTLAFADGTTEDYFDGYRVNPRLVSLFYGPLPDNFRHTLKAAVDYAFPFGLDIGVRVQWRTGAPQWRVFQSPEDFGFNLYRSPRGSDIGARTNDPTSWTEFRLPDQFQVDLEARYGLQKLTGQRIDIMVLLFNALNNTIVTGVDTRSGTNFGVVTRRLDNFFAQLGIRYRY
ncbi:MAG: carboxypeptidase-like regulatory domain-containing protein [Myxococcales bacterium]|nr:carboxypeptidase-like regulatory domain-containing protein [Myxococcota bacterium]MDW8282236.1 carboxypeptidase-like regulatory domain-containing protein [Myxococcales bacterium]